MDFNYDPTDRLDDQALAEAAYAAYVEEFVADKLRTAQPAKPVDDTRYGTWLDEGLRLQGSEGTKLLDCVLAALKPHKQSKRRQREDHRTRFVSRIECILASALRAHFYRRSDRVAYGRGQNDYTAKNRAVEGGWLSASSLRADVDLLEKVGLIGTQKGVWTGATQGFEGGSSSTFWPLQPLKDLFGECQVTKDSIGKPPPGWQALVQLRGEKSGEDTGSDVAFEWTDEPIGWATKLEAYNLFADAHDVWIDNLSAKGEATMLADINKKRAVWTKQPGFTQLELFDRHLRRVFNDGTFEHGGRLYGAWYQQIPNWHRKRIVIDEEPTVELDYSGMSVRMLYHQRRIDYVDDPYSIEELEAYARDKGRPKDYYRQSVKQLVQALLNGDEDKRPEMTRALDESFQPRFTRAAVRDLIFAKHPEIKDAFGSGIGKRLQRLDSDIAMDVILGMMADGILCLPVHDSFIVDERHVEALRQQMIASYRNRLGHDPIIK